MDPNPDRGPTFDGITIGRPATGALADAGYVRLADLPDDLEELLRLHGVGPSALRRLTAARADRARRTTSSPDGGPVTERDG